MISDLRTGSMCAGGGEQAILMAATAQMGRFYNLPVTSIAGITGSMTLDAQYGSEKNLAVSSAAHTGSNLITQAYGMQAGLRHAGKPSGRVAGGLCGRQRHDRQHSADPARGGGDCGKHRR
ncbi:MULTISPECIES: trimethylamine methyltransferase family protein [unclassified Leisingera]|uniref:trimethylamine methyltransferase family protein n=1 Tax=unclassified Leisingera TaxID=2614906 RepID=UPI0020C75EC6|nr:MULTISPECIES: trimethylamine methyltransferase family protein [unclassified Leisingera]